MIRDFNWNDLYLLLVGLRLTGFLTLVSFAFGSVLGLALAVSMVFGNRPVKLVCFAVSQLIQATPVLILLFLCAFGSSYLGLQLPAHVTAPVALVLYSGVFLGEIWRGCIQAIPKDQWESSEALGMSFVQQCRYIIFPQAFRIALAPTVGFLAHLIKNTSIASIVGFIELTRTGQLLMNITFQPFLIFCLVGLLYFCICFPLTSFSRYLEARYNVDRKAQ